MKDYESTEIAYKNGYEAGHRAAHEFIQMLENRNAELLEKIKKMEKKAPEKPKKSPFLSIEDLAFFVGRTVFLEIENGRCLDFCKVVHYGKVRVVFETTDGSIFVCLKDAYASHFWCYNGAPTANDMREARGLDRI